MHAFGRTVTAGWALAFLVVMPSLAADRDGARPAGTASKSDAVPGSARNGGVVIKRIRIGRHDTKTRIVLDTSAPVEFDYQISDGGRTIVLLLPGVDWKARPDLRLKGNRNIDRISFFPNRESGGGVLSIQARQPIGLSGVLILEPWKHWGHRIALDIPYDPDSASAPPGGVVRAGRIYPPDLTLPPRPRAAKRRPAQTARTRSMSQEPLAAPPAEAAKSKPQEKPAPPPVPLPASLELPTPPANLY